MSWVIKFDYFHFVTGKRWTGDLLHDMQNVINHYSRGPARQQPEQVEDFDMGGDDISVSCASYMSTGSRGTSTAENLVDVLSSDSQRHFEPGSNKVIITSTSVHMSEFFLYSVIASTVLVFYF